jgi:dolichol-phosphate hexosyltransferase
MTPSIPQPERASVVGRPSVSALSDTVVLIPAYREARGIGPVIEEVRGTFDATILVINRPDGDATGAVARASGVTVLIQNGRGKGDAVRIGLDYVREHLDRARFIGLIDADCTYPSFAMGSMRQILAENPAVGMVVARRENIANNGRASKAFAWGNHVLARVHRSLNRVRLDDPLSGLRLFKAEVVRDWIPRARGFDIECELNDYVRNEKGLTISEVPVVYRERVGQKKLRFRHGLTILMRMLRLRLHRIRHARLSSGTADSAGTDAAPSP